MRQVGSREAPAGEARTIVLDRRRVVQEALIPDVEPAARDPELAVPGDPLKDIKTMKDDAAAVEKESDAIKVRYTKIFHV